MIYILNATGKLTKYESQITIIINDVLEKYNVIKPINDLDIVVAENPGMSIPGRGLGGYTSTAHELYIPLDLSDDVEQNLDRYLALTMAHELSHVVRLQAGQPLASDGNLGDNVVGEGLADHLSLDLYPDSEIPWTHAVSGEELESLKTRFLKEYQQKPYDHNAWFYGAEYADLPHWGGYSLGYALIEDYLKLKNADIKDILLVSSDDILSVWR